MTNVKCRRKDEAGGKNVEAAHHILIQSFDIPSTFDLRHLMLASSLERLKKRNQVRQFLLG